MSSGNVRAREIHLPSVLLLVVEPVSQPEVYILLQGYGARPMFYLPQKVRYLSRGRPLDLHVVAGVLVVHGRGNLRDRSRHQVSAGGLRLGGRRICTGSGDYRLLVRTRFVGLVLALFHKELAAPLSNIFIYII